MTMYDFMLMDEHKQNIHLLAKGKPITTINKGISIHALYSFDKFFVEVEHETLTNTVIGRKLFASGFELEKYYPTNLSFLPN